MGRKSPEVQTALARAVSGSSDQAATLEIVKPLDDMPRLRPGITAPSWRVAAVCHGEAIPHMTQRPDFLLGRRGVVVGEEWPGADVVGWGGGFRRIAPGGRILSASSVRTLHLHL